MILREATRQFEVLLSKVGISSPRVNVEWLLCKALNVERSGLLLQNNRELTEEEYAAVGRLVERRCIREPLQYILGSTSFCGCEICTSPGVLVPRPETELLAECGWKFLQGRKSPDVLDYCTGSGCIAISLARYCPGARIAAIDVSDIALEIARKNVRMNGFEGKIWLIQGTRIPLHDLFDLIISNPPYIPSAEMATLEPEVSKYEPAIALDGGADGLDFYRYMASSTAGLLKQDGALMAEFGDGQYPAIEVIFREAGWGEIVVHKDYAKKERFFVAKLA